jgi:LPS sulfotransferase NodH
MTNQIPNNGRPDITDIAGPDYDLPSESPAEKTLIICAAPQTGSYELCRYLLAAGVGIPHEYLHPQFAAAMSNRWDLPDDPLGPEYIDIYLQMLRLQRGRNGVFVLNLQMWQFPPSLYSLTGAKVFNGAQVVHLYQPDVVSQIMSYRAAMHTGVWDFSGRPTLPPRPYPATTHENLDLFESDLNTVLGEDTGFRRLFAMLGISPIFLTTPQLFAAPKEIVCELARLVGVEPDIASLDAMLAASEPYAAGADEQKLAYEDISTPLQKRFFGL